MDRVLRDKKAIIIFILPGLIIYTVFMFYPICRSIYFSFFEGVPGLNFEYRGIYNYKLLLDDNTFRQSFSTTVKYMIFTAAGQLILGATTALFLAYGMKRFVNFSRTAIYMPVIIPAVGVAALFSKIYEFRPQLGLLNSLLASVGLEQYVQAWLGQNSTALGALVAAEIWRFFGYYTVIFYAGIVEIPKELQEAAKIDGATTLQSIRKIVLPLLRPITIMSLILCLNNTFRVYDVPVVLTNGGPGRATYMLSMYTYHRAFNDWRYGYASVLAVVMMIFILVVTQGVFLVNKKINKGEE